MKIKWPARPHATSNNIRKPPGLAYDCELAARLRAGDRWALRHLVERHAGRVHTYLLHRMGAGNDEIIDRVLTATFNDALRLIGPYANGSATTPLELWLIGRAERNLSRVGGAANTAGQTIDAGEPVERSDLERFCSALAHIPDRFRSVLVLAVIEQMPAGDIAQCLGVSPGAAMRRLRAALKSLGMALANQEAT